MSRQNNDRDRVLDDAIRAGKIEAARRHEYARMFDANPVATRRLLTARVEDGGLMPGLRGPGEDPATASGSYDSSWLSPIERARINANTAPAQTPPGSPPRTRQRSATAQGPAPAGDEYPSTWLSGEEWQRIEAAKDGRAAGDRVQFEGPDARAAVGR